MKRLDMMIPHHEGAIMVCKHALQHATGPEIKEMVQNIIRDQH